MVLRRCVGKRVLHVGCVDSGLLAQRFRTGELLHQRLAGVAAELWGADSDCEGIAFLQGQGVPNLLVADAGCIGAVAQLQAQQLEVIVATELVEHLANPGLFLTSVQGLMTPTTELIITVPNAFRLDTLLHMLRRVELVHPDHNYWFSYHTITTLLGKHGLHVKEMLVYSHYVGQVLPPVGPAQVARPATPPARRAFPTPKPGYLLRKAAATLLCRLNPFWGDGLVVVATR